MAETEAKNIIGLNRAMSEIKQACEEAAHGDKRSPFFFFVGSGISYPSVPLAPAVQKDCETKARSLGRNEGPKTPDVTPAFGAPALECFSFQYRSHT